VDRKELKKIRKLHRLTQTKFAEKIGVSRGIVAHWEIGKTPIPELVEEKIRQEFPVGESRTAREIPVVGYVSAAHASRSNTSLINDASRFCHCIFFGSSFP